MTQLNQVEQTLALHLVHRQPAQAAIGAVVMMVNLLTLLTTQLLPCPKLSEIHCILYYIPEASQQINRSSFQQVYNEMLKDIDNTIWAI